MRIKSPKPLEKTSTMLMPCILISYYRKNMLPEEYQLVNRLITDLFSVGINVIIDEIQDIDRPLTVKVQADAWILLVQMQDSSSFALVKKRLTKALDQNGKQQFQRIRHVIVSASLPHGTLPIAEQPITFDASIDYPRAFAGIVLTLYPNNQTHLYGIERGAAPLAIAPHRSLPNIITGPFYHIKRISGSRHPFHMLHLLLIIPTLLVVFVALFLIFPLMGKTTGNNYSP